MVNLKQRKWLLPPVVVLGMLALAALACSSVPDHISVREHFILPTGEQRYEDQVIVAEQITLQPGSTIQGSATLMASKIALESEVQGDVVAIGDDVVIGDTAQIAGDLIYCADRFYRSDNAQIAGTVKQECDKGTHTSLGSAFQSGVDGWRDSFSVRLGGVIASALFFGAFAGLSVVVLPRPLSRMSASIRRAPLNAGGIGCLTVLVAGGLSAIYVLSLVLVIPLLLLPLVLLGWMLLVLLALLGWVALAEPFGRYLFKRLGATDLPPMVVATVGGILLSLAVQIWGVFWFTGWVGFLVTLLLGVIGLGAAVQTRAGTRPLPDLEPPVVRSTQA